MLTSLITAIAASTILAAGLPVAQPADDTDVPDLTFPIAAKQGLSASHKLIPDQSLRDMGHSLCTGIDSGLSKFQVAELMKDGFNRIAIGDPMTDDEAGWIMGSAVAAYCPAHNADPITG